ncbi:MAG: hypothetical protein ACI8TQ_003439 [Planctomycetota bacterium]|jgi:hypothetical protein
MTESPPSRKRDSLAFFLVWLPYAALVHRFWFVADDAYISFRYSRNWGQGLGIRFNVGDHTPAEGYSNFLMVAAGALIEKLGLDMQFWLPMLAAVCGSALLWLAFRVMRERFEVSFHPACLAILMLGCSAPFAVWSSTGLEAMPYALLFFATAERLILRRNSPAGLTAGLLALLLSLTRVEGLGWAAIVFPTLCFFSRRQSGEPIGRALIQYYAVLLVGYGSYFLWRWNLFELLWPTTVYAKVGFSVERALRGVDYITVQVLTCLSLLALIPGCMAAMNKKRRSVGIPLALLPIGCAVYTVLVGGDWMTFARFLLPGFAFIAVLFGCFLDDVTLKWNRATSVAFGVIAIVLSLLPGFDIHLIPESVRAKFHFRLNTPDYRSEFAQWEFMRWNGIRWTTKGRALRAIDPGRPTVVMGAIGAASYVSNWFCLDRHGFVTPEVVMQHAEPNAELRSPGHDRVVPEGWFVEHGYDPDYLRVKLQDATTRQALSVKLKSSMKRLRQTGHDDRYVVDFHRLGPESSEAGEPSWYLLLWCRIEDGTESKTAWSDLEARIAEFVNTGKAQQLDVDPPGNRVPGIPDWF